MLKKIPLLSIKMLAAIAIFLSFFLIITNNLDPDLGWHIKSGEWIVKHLAIQHFDEFSFSMAGYRWVNHEWLIDTILYLAQTHHFWWIIITIFATLTAIPPIYYIFRSQNKLSLTLIFGLAFALTPYLGIRPQIISWFIFFLIVRFFNQQINKKIFTILDSIKIIGLFWLWSNFHASFPIGFLLYFIFIITSYFSQKKTFPIARHILTFTIALCSTFINPYGLELYQEILKVALSGSTSQYIVEWQSALVFFNFENWIIIATAILFVVGFRKKINLFHLVSTIIFLLAYLKSVRLGPFFFIVFYPIIISLTPQIIKKIDQSISQNSTIKFQLYYTIIVLFFILTANTASKIAFVKPSQTPDQAIQFLQNNFDPAQIKMFNTYAWGGYLINHYPENKVFIDGRMPHWIDQNGNSAMQDYTKINMQPLAWQNIFPKYGINTVFIKNTNHQPTTNFLSQHILSIINRYPILQQFAKKYIAPSLVDLESELIQNNWRKIYQDNQIVILQDKNSKIEIK